MHVQAARRIRRLHATVYMTLTWGSGAWTLSVSLLKAVETFGRVGAEARQWLRRLTLDLPEDVQTAELTRAYKVISCAVQSELALQLRKASGLS